MVAVFLNYRRDDSRHITERIHDRLRQAFGADRVFKDVDSISPGDDFRLAIQRAVGNCQVLLAVIGNQWLSLADLSGRRRIDDEDDYVRLEIQTALNRNVRVIPILVDGALPPRPADLPVCLEGLAYVQTMSVRSDPDFHNDMDRLIAKMQQEAEPHPDTVPLCEQVAAIYELLQYEVERHKVIAGRTVELFLTGKHGDLEVHRVIGCYPNPVSSDDLHRFTDLLRIVKREYRQARGTIVSARPMSAEVAALANQDDLNLTTHTELSGKLLDGRAYASGLRLRCGDTEQYPTPLYVVPMIGETVQGGERPAFTRFVRPAGGDAPLRDDPPGAIERWLTDPKSNQLTLLGDVGTGKTFMMRILASELARRYLDRPATQPLPLLIDLRDTDREISLEGLVLTHLQSQGLRQITFPVFEHAVRNGQIIILFDGFDEMAARTSPQVTRRNFQQLARCARGKAKILITCRTHYFTSRTEEEEVVLGSTLESDSPVARELLRDLIDGQNCQIAYLRPFELMQIREYVQRARPKDAAACLRKIDDVYNLSELCQRPMLLQMIVKSIDRLGSSDINPARLYEVFTEVWINRDTWRAILPRDRKLQFVMALARVFWQQGVPQIHYTDLINHVKSEFAVEIQDPRRLVEIDSEVRTATFLTRDDQGHYGFAHKSYAEYFLARDLSARLNASEIDCLRTKPLTTEVLTFLKDLIDVEAIESLLEARLTGEYVRLVSENCLLMLYGIRRQSLLNEARELGQQTDDLVIVLPDRAVLPQAMLPSVNLEGAVLRNAILDGADLSSSSLVRCDLSGASLMGANLEQCHLTHATIHDTDCSGANLRNSVWLGVHPAEGFRAEGADWSNATVSRELSSQVGLALSTPTEVRPDVSLLEPEWWQEILLVCRHEARRARRLGDRGIDTEDLISLVALHLLGNSPAIIFNEPRAFRSYVRRLCMTTIRRMRLKQDREILECDLNFSLDDVYDDRQFDPKQSSILANELELLARLLSLLPERERTIIQLSYFEGMSFQKICGVLEISVSTLYQINQRAMSRLREAIAQVGMVD